MWKKEEVAGPTLEAQPEPQVRADRPVAVPRSVPSERASIGRSITIRGDVSGDEDLLIQGRVDGSVNLQQHSVTVGSEGVVKASISGRVVVVEGRVEGNISSAEQVVLRSSALVNGDITAPRLVLEDGARFRGGVDMGDVAEPARGSGNSGSGSSGQSNQQKRGGGSVASVGDKERNASDGSAEATS